MNSFLAWRAGQGCRGRLGTNDAHAAVSDFFFFFTPAWFFFIQWNQYFKREKKLNCSIISSSVFYPLIQIWFVVAVVDMCWQAKGANGYREIQPVAQHVGKCWESIIIYSSTYAQYLLNLSGVCVLFWNIVDAAVKLHVFIRAQQHVHQMLIVVSRKKTLYILHVGANDTEKKKPSA